MIIENLVELIKPLEKRFDEISEERKELLAEFSKYIFEKAENLKEVNLTFICTHNSRRSHMTQIWAQTAAEYYSIPKIKCFSGGTEATAFNPRAVKSIRDLGLKIEQKDETENPVYLVYYSNEKEPLQCFSKIYSNKFNPHENFAAIMTCSNADKNCPVVFGAESRFPIRYDDPKEFDCSELEELKYSERFEQIGAEMLFVFNKI